MNIITVKDLSVAFEGQAVFEELSFKLKEGSTTSLIGQNGVGKTTLIRVLMKMLQPTTGQVTYSKKANGDPIKVGYVPQFRNIDKDYPLSVKNFIQLNAGLFKSKAYKQSVDNIIQETNLAGIQNSSMGELSGGEKQRAYLAQALIDNPDFIILDESTASLDPNAKLSLMNLVKQLNKKRNITVLFATHDIELAKEFTEDYIFMQPGSYETGKIKDFDESRVGR